MCINFNETENFKHLARFDFLDVCLLGETGTGKTHVARLIHDLSPRFRQNFVDVNCAELSPSIIESELFGYEKGAFTGATGAKTGKFEAATGGTLFLDEIGELDGNLQAKLLKVVEGKTVTRVGGIRPRPVDVRVIYATHRNLSALREDFRYRITAHTIRLKPLRERRGEIVSLARIFLIEFSGKSGRTIGANDSALKLLENFDWRGNVRELRSFVQKACLDVLLIAEKKNQGQEKIELTEDFLSARLVSFILEQNPDSTRAAEIVSHFRAGEKMDEYFKEIETHLLQKVMKENNYNQTQAAKCLGISRGGLINKLRRMNH